VRARVPPLAGRRRELVTTLDESVPVLSATDLLVFKALFDRREQWADIEEIVRYGKPDVAAGSPPSWDRTTIAMRSCRRSSTRPADRRSSSITTPPPPAAQ
jgi:hypothetical protein